MRACRLDGPETTLVLAAFDERLPICVYWGEALPENEDLEALARALAPPLPRGTLDIVPEPSLCPEAGWAYPGEVGLQLADDKGRGILTQFRLTEFRSKGNRLSVDAVDEQRGIGFSAELILDPKSGVLIAESILANHGDQPIQLLWMTAPALPAPAAASHFLDYAGRWTQELGERRVPFVRGVHSRTSRRGRPGHDHFPGLVVAPADAAEGEAYGWHLGWSGNHRMMVEELPDGRRLVQFGEALDPGEVVLGHGDTYRTPPLYLAFAKGGINGLSHAFQSHVRRSVLSWPEPDRPRPVHYNCWEAVYFDHKLDRLMSLVEKAAHLGAERFVLDDGWFGERHDDTTSLGDWYVDTSKYPDGLHPLIEHVERHGMTFGLWVEPEMISPLSELAKAHPEWIIAPADYEPILGRQQHVLDLSNEAVADYLLERLSALLTEYRIDYLKWDMNRDLALALDAEGHALGHRQIVALYALLSRLRKQHPVVEIESCASGGARFDYGILRHTQRVWLSDSNDAHERWRMQQAAQAFLPPEIVGSHVGPRICHTSGRQLSMAFRAAVAMTGHMGFEMDLDELTDSETRSLAAATAFYKTHRSLLHTGRQYRLMTPDWIALAQMTVSPDQSQFLLFHGTVAVDPNEAPRLLNLQGLDPECRYRVRIANLEILSEGCMRGWVSLLADPAGLVLAGATLMRAGIGLPLLFPDTMLILEGHKDEAS